LKNIQFLIVLLWAAALVGVAHADSDSPSLFSLTYYEMYGTPVAPVAYTQIDSDALGFDVLAEYNPSYYASFGLDLEKTEFFDGFNSTISFLGVDVRFYGAPNTRSPFAPYLFGGASLGLNTGTGNELKAGLGSRIQFAYPFFLDFSAGSNWVDSGLQYLIFKGGLSVSFDLPKVEPIPTRMPTVGISPVMTVSPVGTLVDLMSTPSATPTLTSTPTVTLVVTNTPTVTATYTSTSALTSTPTIILTATSTLTMTSTPGITDTPSPIQSRVKMHYKAGMKAFEARHYLTAIAEFKKALAIQDPTVQSYFYAESNAMLGVIYQFDSTKKGHNALAVEFYKKALKVDPATASAKKYLKMLQAQKTSKVSVPTATPSEGGDKDSAESPAAAGPTPVPQVKAVSPAPAGN